MNFDFEKILFYATVVCGVIALLDIIFWAKSRQEQQKKMPLIIDYARSFFPILLLVFFIRSFLYEPFRIPSGSLKPTLDIGDFILVNKFDYGIRLPVIHKKLFDVGLPKRGDIIVFRWPPNPSLDFIKRVVGVPGDRISYINKELFVNGEKISQSFVKNTVDQDESGAQWQVVQKEENLLGVTHEIFETPDKVSDDFHDIIVPPGMYFALGDNRDDSADSRFFGFVPETNIVGKATRVWMSWNGDKYQVRWGRIGKKII